MLGIDLLAATVRSSRKLFGLFFNFGHLIGLALLCREIVNSGLQLLH
jgi:hypothetical protein